MSVVGPSRMSSCGMPSRDLPPYNIVADASPRRFLFHASNGHAVGVEGKLRQWLATISKSENQPNRPWDDSQIANIVEFAQTSDIEQLSAEEIYKQYVDHTVELAEAEAELS